MCWLFTTEKLSEANRKYANLKAELQMFLNHHEQHHRNAQLRRRRASMSNIPLFKVSPASVLSSCM